MTVDTLSDLDLSYTPPLGSPWDATQIAAQTWANQHRPLHGQKSAAQPQPAAARSIRSPAR